MLSRFVFSSIVAAGFLFTLFGCESKYINYSFETPALNIRINVSDASPKLLAQVDLFRVTVVEVSTGTILAISPLTLNGQFIEGQIDSLPSGIDLEFTAEAVRLQDGATIYEGSVIAVLTAGEVTDVLIPLSPVVPVMKNTPRFDRFVGADNTSHSLDVKIFNINQLYGTSFRVRYDQTYILLDSAMLSSTQNPSNVIFFESDGSDIIGAYKAISVTNTVPGLSIADGDGDAVLATVYYSLETPVSAPGTTYIYLEPTGITLTDSSNVLPSILFPDETMVELVP